MEKVNANVIKALMALHGHNQADLAKGIEVSREHLSALFNGKKKWSLKTLEKISNFYKVPMSNFFIWPKCGQMPNKE